MRIVIDMQGAQSDSRFRGIGRYTMAFTRALVRFNNNKHEILLILNGGLPESIEFIREEFCDLLPTVNIRTWYPVIPVSGRGKDNKWRQSISELIREAFILSLKPDIIYLSSLFEGYVDNAVTGIDELNKSTILKSVSFYDLIPLIYPEEYLRPEERYEKFYRQKLEQLKKFDLLLGISQHSTQQAIELLDLPPNKIVNISTAVDQFFCPILTKDPCARSRLNQLGILQSFLLYVGGGDPRKNIKRLVEAFAKLPDTIKRKNVLVVVGPNIERSEFFNLVPSTDLEKIFILGHVSDDDLRILYSECEVFIFPSLYEGFGLPVLEAMSCGAPVIASNTSSIPEVVGLKDALFNPFSVEDISNKILKVMQDDAFRKALIANAKIQSVKFSWAETAKCAMKNFERLFKLAPIRNKHEVSSDNQALHKLLIKRIADVTNANQKPKDKDLLQCAVSIANTFPPKNGKPKIYVDISELAQRDARTGIQRVTRAILRELLVNPPEEFDIAPVYGNTLERGYRHAKAYISKFMDLSENSKGDELIDPQEGDIFLGLDLQHHTTRVQENFIKEMRLKGVKTYFVIYDLLPIQFPHYWPPEHNVHLVHEEWLKVVCQGNGVICISSSVADEVRAYISNYRIEYPRYLDISSFHLGADLQNSAPSTGLDLGANDFLEKLGLRPSFLMVGTIEPRKGCEDILRAFIYLWDLNIDVNLVYVGKQGWMMESVIEEIKNHIEYQKRLFWLDGISDEYLEKVYKHSTCLVAASYGEGFGLPLIEAAQHGLPIIARDIPVFREVAKENAYFFNSTDSKGVAKAIIDWLDLYKKGLHIKSSSMPWITWKQSTQQLLACIGVGQIQEDIIKNKKLF